MSGNSSTKDPALTDVERRLNKALRLIEKLRNKYDFEKEVGQELALRNENLKRDLYNESERHKHASTAFDELYSTFFDLWRRHEELLTKGLPAEDVALQDLRAALDDQKDTAERLKRFANPPSAKHKKKSRRASEVGINIQAELGTSLIRSRTGSTAVTESAQGAKRVSLSIEENTAQDEHFEFPESSAGGTLNRKDTLVAFPKLSGAAGASGVDAIQSRKSSVDMGGANDLDYYSDNSMIPLFEHFIVVGVSMGTAEEVLGKLNKQAAASEAVSSRWLRKLGLTKMISNDNSPASSTGGRRSSNITPERPTPKDNFSHSPHMEETSRDSMWGSSLFSSNDECDNVTSRATFSSAPAKSASTFYKFGKMFGSKADNNETVESETEGSSFFGRKRRMSAMPAAKLPEHEPITRSDSAPVILAGKETDEIPLETTVEESVPFEVATDVKEGGHSRVFDEEESNTIPLKPPITSSGPESKGFTAGALSRFGFSKKKDSGPVGPTSLGIANTSFGLSFGRLSSNSLVPDGTTESVQDGESGRPDSILKRLPSVDEIAASFLFHDDSSKPAQPLPSTPQKAAPLVEFAEELNPEIIFRYPDNVAPPPLEVADFCMPVGAKLYRVNPREEETFALKILYSHEGTRSGRCFIFMLEDRSMANGAGDDELGDSAARLYGICVIHHRLACSQSKTPSGGPIFEFVTPVCYCFITRFPMFDFFFQVIWSMISGERVLRMQGVQDHPDDEGYERKSYSYVPEKTLTEILFALSKTKPPMFSERLLFSVPSASTIIEHMRLTPPGDTTEHYANAVSWALPCLLDWLSPRTLTWAIGLLLCEVKLIVVGLEPGMVSCAVMSLMSLLRPLTWVAPLIPILPLKHIDFIEAPVPIVAGMVLHGEAFSLTNLNHSAASSAQSPNSHSPYSRSAVGGSNIMGSESVIENMEGEWHPETANILKKCLDSDSLSAVLDLTVADIFVCKSQLNGAKECLLPGAKEFLDSFGKKSKTLHRMVSGSNRTPQFSVTENMKEDAKIFQDMLRTHITDFVDSVEGEYQQQKPAAPDTSAIEAHVEELKAERKGPMSATQMPFQGHQPMESFSSFMSVDDIGDYSEAKPIRVDEFSADVEGVTMNLADAVAAALRADSGVGVIDCEEMHISVPCNEDGFIGISTFPIVETTPIDRAAFLSRFFQTQIFSEYMDELNLGMECLDEDVDDISLSSCIAPFAPDASSRVEGGGAVFVANTAVVSKRHSFDGAVNPVFPLHSTVGQIPRPASSIELIPPGSEGSRVTRKGRLSIYVGGGFDHHNKEIGAQKHQSEASAEKDKLADIAN